MELITWLSGSGELINWRSEWSWEVFFFNGPTPASFFRLFSFFSPSGIELGSHGPEPAALSTRPQPRPRVELGVN